MPCGHSDNGKAYESYQRVCILLARNGMAVLCYDPIGQGERFQLLDAQGKPVIRGTTEHTMAGIGALLVGRQLASYRIWDGFRALDYLASRPEVDPDRLGCTGNSGGGTMTAYLMALDDRITVAAPSCYITSLERLFATIGPQDAEQNITGQVAAGMEHADYVTMRAPKPTLLTVGTRDFFDIQGSWDTFREVKLIYGRLGFGERVDLFESDEEHGFTTPRRVATARWMRRWLLKQDEAVDEPDFPIATDAELQCTRTGQVLSDFKDMSVFDLNAERERELRSARDAANATRPTPRSAPRSRSGSAWRTGSSASHVPRVALRPSRKHKSLTFEVEPGLELIAREIRESNLARLPRSSRSARALGQPGKRTAIEASPPRSPASCSSTRAAWATTTPKGTRTAQRSPFGATGRRPTSRSTSNRPLLGQRVADLLDMLEGLDASRADDDHAGFHVVGVGAAGPVVLHAALARRARVDQAGHARTVAGLMGRRRREGDQPRPAWQRGPGRASGVRPARPGGRLAPLPLTIRAAGRCDGRARSAHHGVREDLRTLHPELRGRRIARADRNPVSDWVFSRSMLPKNNSLDARRRPLLTAHRRNFTV